MDKSELDKLQVLLKYWIDHNKEHGEEFLTWAGKAKELNEAGVEAGLVEASGCMTRANDFLQEALSLIERSK
jgi:hypothetical protein